MLGCLLAVLLIALAARDEQPVADWAGPEKLVFQALMRGADHKQIYIRDERGITQLTDLQGIREFWRLDYPLFAFQTIGKGGSNIHILDAGTATHKTVKRLTTDVYALPSPDGTWIIREESSILVVSSLQGNAPPRILGRSPGFPMEWNCAGDAVFFADMDNGRIVKVQADDGRQMDLTPPDWQELTPYFLSLSCDERVMAIVGGNDQLRVYKDSILIGTIEMPDIMYPHIFRNDAHVLYLLPHDNETSKVMSYELATGEITELIGPIAAFGPVFHLDSR